MSGNLFVPGALDAADDHLARSVPLSCHPASAAWGAAVGRDLNVGDVLVPPDGLCFDGRTLAADLFGWTDSARAHRFAVAGLAARGIAWDPTTWRLERAPLTRRAWQRRFEDERRAEARSRGRFWQPCPRCGEPFGGHEVSRLTLPDPDDEHGGLSTCLACEDEVGAEHRATCDATGHEPTTVCLSGNARSWTNGVERYVPFERPRVECYCARCFTTVSSAVAA